MRELLSRALALADWEGVSFGKPRWETYEVAESADHAISLLGEHGEDAKLLAGGHSLLPLMRVRLAAPSVLVDIGRIGDLNYVRDGGDPAAPRRTRTPWRGRAMCWR